MSVARIGKITLKAGGAEVISLRRGVPIHNDRRGDFVNHVAATFDSYAAKYGEEPEAIVLVLGGLKQGAEAYWTVRGNSEGGATTMLAFASAAIQRELTK